MKSLHAKLTELLEKRKELVAATNEIDEQLASIRNLLPGEKQRSSPRQRDSKTLKDYTREVLKAAGPRGLSKRATARAVLMAGFATDSSDEDFAKSVYVSGINKLVKAGEAEHFSMQDDREGRYRLLS